MKEKRGIVTLENLLYEKNAAKAREAEKAENGEQQKRNYQEILEKVIQIITKSHSSELAEVLNSEEATYRLKNLIRKYLVSEHLVMRSESTDMGDLVDRIYQDMAGISYVKKYLDDPDVEEININGQNGTWVYYSDRKVLVDDKFNTSEECVSIIKKMARMGKVILDGSAPFGDSYLAKGVRMSGAITPVIDESEGGIASIRKQKPASITREKLIQFGTASSEELDFLEMCINNGVSIAVAGSTGSGKTADMGYLLSTIDSELRIITIEDTKELQVEQYNKSGKKTNDVVQMYTKEPPNAVTMNDLLKLSLRLHPDVLVPAEMRGEEAKTATEAGRTGHTILSSLHANSAKNTYDRILTMYLMADTSLSEERILKMIIEAFPIILFKRQLRDKSRKYIEIFEATDVVDGKIIGNTIFKFRPEPPERDGNGKIIRIPGTHERVGGISGKLAEQLMINGVERHVIERFRGKEEKEE